MKAQLIAGVGEDLHGAQASHARMLFAE